MAPGTSDRVAVVGCTMGGPADLAGVEPFLANLFSDPDLVQLPFFLRPFQARLARRIARKRAPMVAENYRKIGGASPIFRNTEVQVQGLAERLRGLGYDAVPVVCMRYTKPGSAEAVQAILDSGATRVLAVSLYPQFSRTTTGSSLLDLRVRLAGSAACDLPYQEVTSYAGQAFYLDALADQIRTSIRSASEPRPLVLFSAHGLPLSYVRRGDPYRDEIETSYRGVVERLPAGTPHGLAFQSRVGRMRWLEPYTDDTIRSLARNGVKRILMVPLAFVSDHVETVYEMDIEYGDLARSLGIGFLRVPALNDHPGFLAGLAGLAHEVLERQVDRRVGAGA